MTRILRLLMIAAVAWPFWQPAAAQEEAFPHEKGEVSANEVSKLTVTKISESSRNGDIQTLGMVSNGEQETVMQKNADWTFKHEKALNSIKTAKVVPTHGKTPKVVRVTKTRANVPEGYAQITLTAGDVWGDGTGYQMLLDVDHNTFGTIIPENGALTESGNVPASTYAEFEYKIPENADGALNTTNIIISSSQSITVPAGTYDWCITNPTPNQCMWIASEQGAVQGRYNDYVFESGFAYTFTISLVGQNDNIEIGITSNFDNPTNLAVSDIANHGATLTWSAGGDETSWNVQYKKKMDFTWTDAGTTTSNSFVFENLLMGTEYQARVQGIYSGGMSGWELVSFITTFDGEDLCEPEDMGEISYTLNDSYGDGWNGAQIAIVDATTQRLITTLTISSGSSSSGTVSLCYGRTVNFVWTAGSYASECSFTIYDPDGEVIASKTTSGTITDGSTFASYTMHMPIKPTNLTVGIVTENSAVVKWDGFDGSYNLRYRPTGSSEWVVINNVTSPYTITGLITGTTYEVQVQGILDHYVSTWTSSVTFTPLETRDVTIKDAVFFEGKTYTWVDENGTTQTSNLTETATDPNQIIAMISKVYTDQEIPGNLTRGFTESGVADTHSNVYYGGIGTINRSSGGSYSYYNGYGWNIGTEMDLMSGSSNNYTFTYMNPNEYRPQKDGLTMLLVELVDDFDSDTYESSTATDPSQKLRDYVKNSVKSVRVLTEAKRMGEGTSAGTLFKIDCDKMNKFFLIAKGQLRWLQNSYFAETTSGSQIASTYCDEPCYVYRNRYINGYFNDLSHPLFYNMFEQFSPSEFDVQVPVSDIYQDLVNMKSFDIKHDCEGVTHIGHQFMMYGDESNSDDCQDVRDLMFFIPDYRMMAWSNRDHNNYQKFLRYNQSYVPSIGLFVIKQYPITGEQIDGQETYKLHLTWTSNLLDFLPGEDGQYTLYRVITNADGTKTYQKVGNFDPNTFAYDDNVPMQQTGQQVTYVVQGQDVDEFLSLQMSNEESFIIPGLDHAEQLRIALNRDYYFSRYDAAEQKNYYSNSLIANNNIGTNVKPAYIENGTQFKFWRATIDEQTGNVVTPDAPFVVAEVSEWDPTTGGTLTYKDWNYQADFSGKPYKHGYHANVATSTISINTKNNQISTDDEVVFDGLKLYDNFSVDVSGNAHPAQYVYYVTLETAVPFELAGNGIPSCATQQSGTYAYFECAWGSTMRAWAWNETGNLTGSQWPGNGTMTQVGTNNGNKVWLWTADASVQPTNIIFNWDDANNMQQTSTYPFTNGGYYKHESDVVSVVESNQARSNTVSVPVYKTEMAMNPISAQDVEDDVIHQFPAATKFDVKTRYSSRSEILGYYIYRWADKAGTSARTIYESNGDDSSPQGQAGNQGEYYTVAMNTDYTSRTENFGTNYADVTATFMDNYMVNEDGDTYTYAPVVELFAPVQAVELPSGADREDYNTYGGPQQMTAGGKIEVTVESSATTGDNGYEWTMNGSTYVYYNTLLKVNVLDLPTGYEVAKVRAWRKVNANNFLGEQAPTANTPDYRYRTQLDSNGEFMFSNYNTTNYDPEGYDIQEDGYIGGEEDDNHIMAGTFGGKKLENGEQVPMDFVVRIYFTKSGAKAGEQPYYIAEVTATDVLTSNIPTSISGVESYRNVVSEKYYNAAGIESDTPFKGVNIVVTRYSDGSTTTTKILK